MTERPKLYVIPGSHPCRAAILMLEQKGVDHRQVELPTGFQGPILRARGFAGRTVPALAIGERRVQTNHDIARVLEGLFPEPSLFPSEGRKAVEEAERFADRVLQTTARRLVLSAGMRDISWLADDGDSGRLGALLHRKTRARARIMWIAGHTRRFGITKETEALDLAAVPPLLDRIGAWIESGVLNGEELNAADFQIAPSVCLLAYRSDLRSEVESSRAWELARRIIPAPEDAGAVPEKMASAA